VDADILVVFVQYVLKLMHIRYLNVMEHRNIILEHNLVVTRWFRMSKGVSIIIVPLPSVLFEQKHGNRDKASMPVIPKWRSAENACVEIEKFLGNEARDVSTQNLGYDVESTNPLGDKRYIEVKSVSKNDRTFCLTNNEYTAAHQFGDAYYICLLLHGDEKSKAVYIQNPLAKLKFEKRIRQWEWYCEEYQGEEILYSLYSQFS